MIIHRDDTHIYYDEGKIPRNLNFLIVDDEPDITAIICENIAEMGFSGQCFQAASIEEATSFLNDFSNGVSFIISDWNLGGLSGLDFLISVRANEKYKQIPFLMVTANDNVSGMLVATKKGASDYLVKPWTAEELEEKIISAWSVLNPLKTV